MRSSLFGILACPDDRTTLTQSGEVWCCGICGTTYQANDHVLDLLPAEHREAGTPFRQRRIDYEQRLSRRRQTLPVRLMRRLVGVVQSGFLYAWAGGWISKFETGLLADLGCGDGALRPYISTGIAYLGLDFSSELLGRIRTDGNVTRIRGDLNKLPFSSGSISSASCLQALQYTDKPELVLDEIRRVLTPGGLLILSVPNHKAAKYTILGGPEAGRRWTPKYATRLVSERFEIVDVSLRGYWLPLPIVQCHLPTRGGARRSIATAIVATARRS